MEFVGLLSHIDNDENIGETWIEALIRSFYFPQSPNLFHLLRHVNKRIGELKEEKNETCQCTCPSIVDPWSWTKHFPIEKTRVVILAGHENGFLSHSVSSQVESHWGKQGVLLIGTRVSPQCEDNDKHTAWKRIVHQLMEYMANNCPGVLFILIGNSPMNFKFLHRDGSRVLNLDMDRVDHVDESQLFCLFNEKLEQFNQEPVQWEIN